MFERRGKERNEKQVAWIPCESHQQVLKDAALLGARPDTKTKNKYVPD